MNIAFQDEVKKSFSAVKKDMIAFRRSLNQGKLAADMLNARMRELTSKDEFYSFIKRLGERLDRIDSSLERTLKLERSLKNLDEKTKGVSERILKKEELNAEVKDLKKLKSRFDDLESSTVDRNRFTAEIESLHGKFVDRNFLGKREKGLKKELNSIRRFVEASVVEVDLGQYVTRKDLDNRFSSIDDLNSEVARISADLSNMDSKEEESGSERESSSEDEYGLRSEINRQSQSLDLLKEDFEKLAEKVDEVQEKTVDAIGFKIEKEFERLKEKTPSETRIARNIKRGVSVFLKDDERDDENDEGKKDRDGFNVSEFVDGEERKRK